MGLVRGFVLSLNRRGLLAVLAIAVSVGYALVAGTTLTGLEDAQDTLATDLHEPSYTAIQGDLEGFNLEDVPLDPDRALAVTDRGAYTFYTVRAGHSQLPNETGQGIAGPSASVGTTPVQIRLGDVNLTVERGEAGPGARSDWIEIDEATFDALGGPSSPTVHVATFEHPSESQRSILHEAGFETHQAPAALSFYVSGTEELITSIGVTVASSAVVVALLASGFVNMELRAKRKTLATLKLYAGAARVRRVIAGRGLVLLAAGHVLALAAVFALTLLLASASPLDVALEPGFAAAAASATFLGGTIGLAGPLRRAGERVEASALADREPPGWLPAWLRPSLASWRILVPLIAAAVILAASLGIVFGMVDLPTQLFGHEGEQVIADASNNPLRGSVDPFVGYHLGNVDGFAGASPEIYVPTTIDGEAVMVRGISWTDVSQMEQLSLTEGRTIQSAGEAIVGARLADRHDIDVGDNLRIPSAYTASITPVQVVGVARGGGLLADELLIPLSTARGMTHLEEGRVNMVRFAAEEDSDPTLPEGIEATNLSLSPSRPIPFEEVTVEVGLVNFGDASDTRRLTLRVNGQPVDDAWPTVPGHSMGVAQMSFTVPSGGVDRLAVNPETRPTASQPAYGIDVPSVVTVDRPLDVQVDERDGSPAADVRVAVGGVSNRTDGEGRAQLPGIEPGNRTLTVEGPEGRAAEAVVFVERADLHRPHLVLQQVQGPSRTQPGETWRGVASFVNLGGEAFEGRPDIGIDNRTETLQQIRLLSGQQTRVPLEIDADEGEHRVGTNETGLTFNVGGGPLRAGDGERDRDANGDDPYAGDRSLEELLEIRREQARSSSQAGQSATQAFLGDTFANLNAALTLIVTATVLHAGLVTFVAVFRQTDERRSNVGTLSAIGASEGDVRGRAIREYATVGLPAALLGVGLGLLVARLLSGAGLLTGFGHALVPRTGTGFAIRIVLAALATTVVAAFLAVQAQSADRGGAGPTRAQRPPLETLTGATEE